jgi:Tfp pilus assembly protein PilP
MVIKITIGKSVLAALIVFTVFLVFKSPLCFAGTSKNGSNNSAANAAGKTGAAYPYYLKRDPFQTFLYTQKHVTSFKAGELPLLQYGISSLRVVGIMNRRGKYFAMLQTPDNRSYIITVGSLVGVNRARVVSINGSEVNLVERTYNILGQMRSINVVMGLK